MDFGQNAPIDASRVAAALAADRDHRIRAVVAVHVDTSTSVRNDVPALRAAIDDAQHPALLMIDCIASLGCDRYEMDNWGVDLTVAACQKGLMTPPGMGFLFFNDRADAARERCTSTSHYWDWRSRMAAGLLAEYFDGTAPTHLLYGLRQALDMIAEEGLENIWHRHATLARCYWVALEAWGQGGPVRMNIADPANRTHAVTSVAIGAPHATELRTWMCDNAGVSLGIGLGMAPPDDPAWHGYFRIGHMGHVNAHMALGTIGAIQSGLTALNIPFGKGALDAASAVCAAG
jgi:alanine-glyoxylate transaminase/serine-glyoxylate transaminase/serine-pyruvate transaminase